MYGLQNAFLVSAFTQIIIHTADGHILLTIIIQCQLVLSLPSSYRANSFLFGNRVLVLTATAAHGPLWTIHLENDATTNIHVFKSTVSDGKLHEAQQSKIRTTSSVRLCKPRSCATTAEAQPVWGPDNLAGRNHLGEEYVSYVSASPLPSGAFLVFRFSHLASHSGGLSYARVSRHWRQRKEPCERFVVGEEGPGSAGRAG